MADHALFVTIARTLAVFGVDKVGETEVRFLPGTLSHPVPFRCSIKARSQEHERLVREEAASVLCEGERGDAEDLAKVRW